jgi:hypothetical protein
VLLLLLLRVVPCSVMSLAASKRANELEKALNAWEDNRLLTSGVVKLRQVRVPVACTFKVTQLV